MYLLKPRSLILVTRLGTRVLRDELAILKKLCWFEAGLTCIIERRSRSNSIITLSS